MVWADGCSFVSRCLINCPIYPRAGNSMSFLNSAFWQHFLDNKEAHLTNSVYVWISFPKFQFLFFASNPPAIKAENGKTFSSSFLELSLALSQYTANFVYQHELYVSLSLLWFGCLVFRWGMINLIKWLFGFQPTPPPLSSRLAWVSQSLFCIHFKTFEFFTVINEA